MVRERRPSFEGSFVETCLLLVGRISGVWARLGDGASEAGDDCRPEASPVAAETGRCMLDMVLAPAGGAEPSAAREAFRLVWLVVARGVPDNNAVLMHQTRLFFLLLPPILRCPRRMHNSTPRSWPPVPRG